MRHNHSALRRYTQLQTYLTQIGHVCLAHLVEDKTIYLRMMVSNPFLELLFLPLTSHQLLVTDASIS